MICELLAVILSAIFRLRAVFLLYIIPSQDTGLVPHKWQMFWPPSIKHSGGAHYNYHSGQLRQEDCTFEFYLGESDSEER